MKTLDTFIRDSLVAGNWATSSYTKETGFRLLYARLNTRFYRNKTYPVVLDIASITANRPGNGAFTRLFKRLRKQYPQLGLFVECVQNPLFAKKLDRMGFTRVITDEGPCYGRTPSYWLAPRKD